jgi:signal transduction histidine kinase
VWLLEEGEMVLQGNPQNTSAVRIKVRGADIEKICDSRTARIATLADAPGIASLPQSTRDALPVPPFLRATLLSGSEVLGVLLVGDRTSGLPFDERDEEILAYIADTASIAIYNRLQSAELDRAYQESSAQALELSAANERLRLLDRLKDDFLTFVSHELRTPLTVLSAIDMLDAGGRPDQIGIVDVVRNGYQRLKHFIETALAYRAWIVGEPVLSDEASAVAALVQAAQLEVSGLRDSKAHVSVILPAEPCIVRGSPTDLTEIFRILLDNAVRFSSGEPHVSIRCEASADEVRISIEDRGAGFDPELAEEILKPFTIADSLHHRSGSALNLAKANAIAIAHGGGIEAESAGPGKGAKFTVRLPRVHSPENGKPARRDAVGKSAA